MEAGPVGAQGPHHRRGRGRLTTPHERPKEVPRRGTGPTPGLDGEAWGKPHWGREELLTRDNGSPDLITRRVRSGSVQPLEKARSRPACRVQVCSHPSISFHTAACIGVRLLDEVRAAGERAAADDNRKLGSLMEKLLSDYLRASGYLPKRPTAKQPGGRKGRSEERRV